MEATTESILATTAALWFANDDKRLDRINRRLLGRPCAAPSEPPLLPADLLPWRTDLDDSQRRQIGESLCAQRLD